MKLLKLVAVFLVFFVFVFSNSSCKKEDKTECCTYTDGTTTEKVCEDDQAVKDELETLGWTWDQYKALATATGASCD